MKRREKQTENVVEIADERWCQIETGRKESHRMPQQRVAPVSVREACKKQRSQDRKQNHEENRGVKLGHSRNLRASTRP